MLKLVVKEYKTDGSISTLTRLFDRYGNTGYISNEIVIIIVVLLLIFGFTFVAYTHVFNFFGIIICLMALALTTWTIQTEIIRFLQAIIIIIGVFIFLVYKEEYLRVT